MFENPIWGVRSVGRRIQLPGGRHHRSSSGGQDDAAAAYVPRRQLSPFKSPDLVARFRADPQGFLDGIRLPAILDEIQHVPEVFAYVRSRIDAAPRRMGRWFLTGSQEAGAGGRRQLWFFRDHEGLEVDFVMPGSRWRSALDRSQGDSNSARRHGATDAAYCGCECAEGQGRET